MTSRLPLAETANRERIAAMRTPSMYRPSVNPHERKVDMPEKLPDKLNQAAEHAKETIERQDEALEEAVKEVDPLVPGAKQRLAEGPDPSRRGD
jgi:hypothetical protein